ncbi:DNA-directed RNA polymerase subunit L [archaeon]|nr:DNA-directed RNA polymerase subunit L [archaeon]
MNVNITKTGTEMITIKMDGARHTLPNAIREELWNDSTVTFAAYEKKHPYLGNPKLIIKSKDPKKSLLTAIKNTQDNIKIFEKEINKLL